jgi:hypothetical protein
MQKKRAHERVSESESERASERARALCVCVFVCVIVIYLSVLYRGAFSSRILCRHTLTYADILASTISNLSDKVFCAQAMPSATFRAFHMP